MIASKSVQLSSYLIAGSCGSSQGIVGVVDASEAAAGGSDGDCRADDVDGVRGRLGLLQARGWPRVTQRGEAAGRVDDIDEGLCDCCCSFNSVCCRICFRWSSFSRAISLPFSASHRTLPSPSWYLRDATSASSRVICCLYSWLLCFKAVFDAQVSLFSAFKLR